jgi:hypothetical protein
MFEYFDVEILLVSLLIILLIGLIYDSHSRGEHFQASFDDKNIDLLAIKAGEKLLNPTKYITVSDFNDMVMSIRQIVYQDIYLLSQVCSKMNGQDGPEKNQMTLFCIADVKGMQNEIVGHIANYVIDNVKSKYGINLNPYQVTGDFMVQLNLLEDVIYPLVYTNLYTVHGIQYFDLKMLQDKVYENLKIRDVLFGTLLRRGIDVSPDIDTLHEVDNHL